MTPPISFIDNGLGKTFSDLGATLGELPNQKAMRAKKLQEDPATLERLAPAYRAAKDAGQEDAFFKGLGVDKSFGQLLDAYQPSPTEQYQKAFQAGGGPEKQAQADLSGLDLTLGKTALGKEALTGYQKYVDNLPDTPLGNHLKQMADIAISNPGLADEIRAHESADNKTPANPLVEYNRWNDAYQGALTRFRKAASPEEKKSAITDVHNLALYGEDLQRQGVIPPSPITDIRESKKWFGLKSTLEEFQLNPQAMDAASILGASVINGKTPDGTPVTLDDMKNSDVFKSLDKVDQNKLLAGIAASTAKDVSTPDHEKNSFFDTLGMVTKGMAGEVANAGGKVVDTGAGIIGGTANLALDAANKAFQAAVKGAGTRRNPASSQDVNAKAPVINTPLHSLSQSARTALKVPVVGSAINSKLDSLDAAVKPKFEQFINALQDNGLKVDVRETLRSQDRQDKLYAQGRTAPGPIVTWTKSSNHTKGKAIDLTINGDQSGSDPGYQKAWQIAQKFGINFLGAKDPGHFELVTK